MIRKPDLILIVSLACSYLATGRASAILPRIPSERELADMPVLVIARWHKAPFHVYRTTHTAKTADHPTVDHVDEWAEIDVERSIRGGLAPGRYKVKLGWSVTWTEEGRHPPFRFSTRTVPEVKDVTK